MPETLLSVSEVLLFGRIVEDLRLPSQLEEFTAKAATTANLGAFGGPGPVDGQAIAAGDNVLVRAQNNEKENGLYTVTPGAAVGDPLVWTQKKLPKGARVNVVNGSQAGIWEQTMPLKPNPASAKQEFKRAHGRPQRRKGPNRQLEDQLFDNDACIARIYGFAYEGVYYELPNATLFLVHGEGESPTADNAPVGQGARAPTAPDVSGVASADYQIANDMRVWSYDKADYTIRLDAMTGMFEEVLLDIFFGVDLPAMQGAMVGGGNTRGAMVSGAMVRGAMVRGAMVRGAMVRGGKNRD